MEILTEVADRAKPTARIGRPEQPKACRAWLRANEQRHHYELPCSIDWIFPTSIEGPSMDLAAPRTQA
jgi:hypothetical protein